MQDPKVNGQQAAYARPMSEGTTDPRVESSSDQDGLTKREAMAMAAPPVPEFWLKQYGEAYNHPEYPKREGHRCDNCRHDDGACLETDECLNRKASDLLQDEFKVRHQVRARAAWAAAWADALLAELAKEA